MRRKLRNVQSQEYLHIVRCDNIEITFVNNNINITNT